MTDNQKQELVITTVLTKLNAKRERVFKKGRDRVVVFPRQVIHYLLCCFTYKSLREIGELFASGQHHSTVIHSRETVLSLMKFDDKIRADVRDIFDELSREMPVTKRQLNLHLLPEPEKGAMTLEEAKDFILKEGNRSTYRELTRKTGMTLGRVDHYVKALGVEPIRVKRMSVTGQPFTRQRGVYSNTTPYGIAAELLKTA